MVQGGGVDGRDGSGSGVLLTESSDISRRIRSNLLQRRGQHNPRGVKREPESGAVTHHRFLFIKLLIKP